VQEETAGVHWGGEPVGRLEKGSVGGKTRRIRGRKDVVGGRKSFLRIIERGRKIEVVFLSKKRRKGSFCEGKTRDTAFYTEEGGRRDQTLKKGAFSSANPA